MAATLIWKSAVGPGNNLHAGDPPCELRIALARPLHDRAELIHHVRVPRLPRETRQLGHYLGAPGISRESRSDLEGALRFSTCA